MSGPAVAIALKVVGTALAVKTAIDGLKEGNLLKAVAGGVGAYFGASSLMSSSAYGQTVGNVTGTVGDAAAAGTPSEFTSGALGGDAINGVVDSGASVSLADAASNSITPSIMNEGASNIAGSAMSDSIGSAAFQAPIINGAINPAVNGAGGLLSQVTEGVNSLANEVGGTLSPQTGQTGLLGDMGSLFNNNQYLTGSALQLYGGMRNSDLIEKQMDENQRRYEEQRALEEEKRRNTYVAPTVHYGYGAK